MKLALASIALSAVLLTSCVTNEQTGRSQLNLVSDSEMNAQGEQAYKEILAKSKISQKPQLNSEIVGIGRRVAQATGVNYAWEFSVLNEPTINAFCLPGGKVAVYTGIIPVAKNNASLAAILGHEIAHAVLRHGAERMSQQMVLQTGMDIASATFGNSAYKDLIAAAMGVGANYGVALPFSRFEESEADRVGLEFMAKAGYDPREAIGLWERMGALGSRSPEILSDHPDPVRRARDLSNYMDKAMAFYNASVKQPTTLLPKP